MLGGKGGRGAVGLPLSICHSDIGILVPRYSSMQVEDIKLVVDSIHLRGDIPAINKVIYSTANIYIYSYE